MSRRGRPVGSGKNAERDNQIIRMYQLGMSMPAIAAHYGVSKQRVHQIIRSVEGIRRGEGIDE